MMKLVNFPAHISNDVEQSSSQHCKNTAHIASQSLSSVNLYNAGYLAGILHDCGKFTDEFAAYIRNSYQGKQTAKGTIIHSFAGVSFLLNNYHKSGDEYEIYRIASEIISCAIGSHHGLFDIYDSSGVSGFEHRLTKQPKYDSAALQNFFAECVDRAELEDSFKKSSDEILNYLQMMSEISSDNDELYFYTSMLTRLLTSAVINGDRIDTASFMSGIELKSSVIADDRFWDNCSKLISDRLNEFKRESSIEIARAELSDICDSFAQKPTGIYRLNLPTGAGKTLSSLRYAISHARQHAKKRIIYTAPLITILEQNAEAIRAVLGEQAVLEHHSNVVFECDDEDQSYIQHFLQDTWDSPVIVTTLVQLLNTLFDGRTSSIRRMQSLIDSVLIIDEVQSVPKNMLTLFNLAMNYLSIFCGTTVLLCSATQPSLEQIGHSMIISQEHFLSDTQDKHYREIFRRNKIIDAGSMTLRDIPNFISDIFCNHNSLLVICNKKSEAEYLFRAASKICENCSHLSSTMCVTHRESVLSDIRRSLMNGERVICVSTQVIEAGVDISFDAVIRLQAGMDSIVQSAGRCNRHGKGIDTAPVYIVNCSDESLIKLSEIADAKKAAMLLLKDYSLHSEKYDNDLSSDKAIDYYYKCLYKNMAEYYCDFTLKDKPSMFSMLSDNIQYVNEKYSERYFMCQAFSEAGKSFKVFDDDTVTLVVPYRQGYEIICQLQSDEIKYDYSLMKELVNQAKKYTISVFRYQAEQLQKIGGIYPICGGIMLALMPDYYDEKIGLVIEPIINEEDVQCSIQIL